VIFLRLLGWQGIAGLAGALALSILLVMQKLETRHWEKQSASFEQLYHQEQSAFATTVASYRAAAELARAADQANVARVVADQSAINERTANDYEGRLAAARAEYQRLRLQPDAAEDPGLGRSAPLPSLSTAARSPAQTAGQDRLPQSDALIATEQAIQLDELINWVKAQAAVDPNSPSATGRQQAGIACSSGCGH
jgi:hypothetical protein